MPASVQDRIASGKARVVLDGSGEGYEHSPELCDRLHAFVRALGVPNWHAAYITQNRGFRDAYLAHCAAAGVRPMLVLTYDLWIKTFFAPLETRGPVLFDARVEAFRARSEIDRGLVEALTGLRLPGPHACSIEPLDQPIAVPQLHGARRDVLGDDRYGVRVVVALEVQPPADLVPAVEKIELVSPHAPSRPIAEAHDSNDALILLQLQPRRNVRQAIPS